MQTLIVMVGSSLLRNYRERDFPVEQRRPWHGRPDFGDPAESEQWLKSAPIERVSAEAHSLYLLDARPEDEIHLLHSDTADGEMCAKKLRWYLQEVLSQKEVRLHRLRDLHYEMIDESPLQQLAKLLSLLVKQTHGRVTMLASGGMKAQAEMMSVVGQLLGVPVCSVPNDRLVYLPTLTGPEWGLHQRKMPVDLPASQRPRDQVLLISGIEHHRPKSWKRAERVLLDMPWVEAVRYDTAAFKAPRNAVKIAPRSLKGEACVLWLHLYDSDESRIAVSIETTGYTPEHADKALTALREALFTG